MQLNVYYQTKGFNLMKEKNWNEVEREIYLKKRDALQFATCCMDEHIIKLYQWIECINELIEDIRECDRDKELEDELNKINNRLFREIGFRFYLLLSE